MMEEKNSNSVIFKVNSKKKYRQYTLETRLKLIDLVENSKMSTAEAGRMLNVKQTSACRIMRSYKHQNRVFERKADKIVRQEQEREKKKLENKRIQKGVEAKEEEMNEIRPLEQAVERPVQPAQPIQPLNLPNFMPQWSYPQYSPYWFYPMFNGF